LTQRGMLAMLLSQTEGAILDQLPAAEQERYFDGTA
jgi:hypothetical protein